LLLAVTQVLQLIHHRVIDTAALYPHPSGLPYKHALRRLAKEYLRKDVQDGKGEYGYTVSSVS
jgi:RNA exonuclease 1